MVGRRGGEGKGGWDGQEEELRGKGGKEGERDINTY